MEWFKGDLQRLKCVLEWQMYPGVAQMCPGVAQMCLEVAQMCPELALR